MGRGLFAGDGGRLTFWSHCEETESRKELPGAWRGAGVDGGEVGVTAKGCGIFVFEGMKIFKSQLA